MELLDQLADGIGRSLCQPMSPLEPLTAYQFVCSDGSYSAGWKLLGTAMVLLGLAVSYAMLTRRHR